MNPYELLELPPGADNATVARAMAAAMKARKHAPHVLAEAQRTLLSPERRLLADFLLPALPTPRRLVVPAEAPPIGPLPTWCYDDFDALTRDAESELALDLAAAKHVADGSASPAPRAAHDA